MSQTTKKNQISAGEKCAFSNMIFAKEGWTPATKMLAITYLDLSEKFGHSFARQPYLAFRSGLSKRTMSRANRTIENSGLFAIEYQLDDSLVVVPNLERI